MTQYSFEGQTYDFPDDATMDEVSAYLQSAPKPHGRAGQFVGGAVDEVGSQLSSQLHPSPFGRMLGVKDNPNLEKQSVQQFRAAADKMGIPNDVADDAWSRAGGNFAVGMEILGTLATTKNPMTALGTARAGAGLVERGLRTVPKMAGKVGQMAVDSPVSAVAGEAGAAIGTQKGGDVAESAGVPRVVGEVGGAVGGSLLGAAPVNSLRKGASFLERHLTPPAKEGLFTEGFDKAASQGVAQRYITKETTALNDELKDILTSNKGLTHPTPGWLDPTTAGLKLEERVVNQLTRAEENFTKKQTEMWEKAVGDKRVMTPQLRDDVEEWGAHLEATQAGSAVPKDFIAEIAGLDHSTAARKIVSIRSELLDLARAGKARDGTVLGPTKVRNYYQLADMLLQTLSRQNWATKTGEFAAARAFSAKGAAIFQGPIGEALVDARVGGKRLNVAETFDLLSKDIDTFPKVKELDKFLKAERLSPMNNQSIEDTMADAFKKNWQEATAGFTGDAASQSKAAAFLERHRNALSRNKTLWQDMTNTYRFLANNIAQTKALNEGVAAKLLNGEPEITLRNQVAAIYKGANPVSQAKELMTIMKQDPSAVQAARDAFITAFFNFNKRSPIEMEKALATGPVKRMMAEVFEPDQLRRLEKITHLSSRLEAGDEKTLRKAWRNGGILLARLVGAGIGRDNARLLGGGTIQSAGVVSKMFKTMAEKALAVLPPDEMFAKAVMDPRWEKKLMNRIPLDEKSTRKELRNLKLLIAGMNVTQEQLTGD